MISRGYKVNLARFPDIAKIVQKFINKNPGYLVEIGQDGMLRLAPSTEARKQLFERIILLRYHNSIQVVEDGTPFAELIKKKLIIV